MAAVVSTDLGWNATCIPVAATKRTLGWLAVTTCCSWGNCSVLHHRTASLQVRYCLHVQQRLLKVEWPIKLAQHHMARTFSVGDMESGGPGGQILFNGLRVRMAISTGVLAACVYL